MDCANGLYKLASALVYGSQSEAPVTAPAKYRKSSQSDLKEMLAGSHRAYVTKTEEKCKG